MSKKSKKKAFKFDPQWAKAKELCRLNMEDIRMAKELGISPRSLMKNRPNKSQQWKLPVKFWIRELYEKMLERRAKKQARKAAEQAPKVEQDVPTGRAPTIAFNDAYDDIAGDSVEADRSYDEIPF